MRRIAATPRNAENGKFVGAPLVEGQAPALQERLAAIVGKDKAAQILERHIEVKGCNDNTAHERVDALSGLELDGRAVSLPWSNFLLDGRRFEHFLGLAREIHESRDIPAKIDAAFGGPLSVRLVALGPKTEVLLRAAERIDALKAEFGDSMRHMVEAEPGALLFDKTAYRAWVVSHRDKASESALSVVRGRLAEIVGDKADSMLSGSSLSPAHMLKRLDALMREHPDIYAEFLGSRTTALSASDKDFEGMVCAYLCGKAERGFEEQVIDALKAMYHPKVVEKLLRCKENALLSAETVLDRIEEVRRTFPAQLPKDKAWLLVCNHHTYNAWMARMKGHAPDMRWILENCPDKDAARKAVSRILGSDKRCDSNTARAIANLKKIRAKGRGALRDALQMSWRRVYEGRERDARAAARTDADSIYERLATRCALKEGAKLTLDKTGRFIAFAEGDFGIPVRRIGESLFIRKEDAGLLKLHILLELAENPGARTVFAQKELAKLLAKKRWNTRDEVAVHIIRGFAGKTDAFDNWGSRLEKACLDLPQHADYRPDMRPLT